MPTDFAKSLYDAEWSRRDTLHGSIGLPLALFTLLGSGLALLFQATADPELPWKPFFFTSFAAAGVSYLVGIYSLVRSAIGFEYERIPLPGQLVAYRTELDQYYASQGLPSTNATAEFEQHLGAAYERAANENAVINIRRAAFMYRANAAAVWTLVFAALAAAPVAYNFQRRTPQPLKVEIINSRDFPMPKDSSKPAKADSAKPAKETVTTSKPQFPSNIKVKTSVKKPRLR